MSGGSFDYMYNRILDMYEGELKDPELEDLLKDFCKVLHDLEWWQSADYSEVQYREKVKEFKKKWLKGHDDETNVRIGIFKKSVQDLLNNL